MNLAILYTALSGILYGSIGYFGVHLMQMGMSVSDLLLWRFSISAVCLLPFLLMLQKKEKLSRQRFKEFGLLFMSGGLLYGTSTYFYFVATPLIGSGLAMVIFFSYPIFVILLSLLVHKEVISKISLLALTLIVLGCLLIAKGYNAELDLVGIALALLSAGCYGGYVFLSKGFSQNIHPIWSTFIVCMGIAFFYALLTFTDGTAVYVPATLWGWSLVLGFAIIGTLLPVLLMLMGMRHLSASKVSILSVLEPVTTLLVGALILHEHVVPIQYIGTLVILGSAIVVQFDKDRT